MDKQGTSSTGTGPAPGDTKVYVKGGGLGENISAEDLKIAFSRFGEVSSAWVAHMPRGFAFVHFTHLRDAEAAITAMNGGELNGSQLTVEISKPRDGPGFKFDPKPGDWKCAQCSVENFARRDRCFRCGHPKGSSPIPATHHSNDESSRRRDDREEEKHKSSRRQRHRSRSRDRRHSSSKRDRDRSRDRDRRSSRHTRARSPSSSSYSSRSRSRSRERKRRDHRHDHRHYERDDGDGNRDDGNRDRGGGGGRRTSHDRESDRIDRGDRERRR